MINYSKLQVDWGFYILYICFYCVYLNVIYNFGIYFYYQGPLDQIQ